MGTCEHGIVHLVEGSERASYTHFASYEKLYCLLFTMVVFFSL